MATPTACKSKGFFYFMNEFEEFNQTRIEFVNKHFGNADILAKALENKEVRDPLAIYFSKYFEVLKEKKDDSGKFRFDLILYHPTDKQKNYPLVIECKKDGRKKGKNIAEWCIQCKNYSTLLFNGKKIYVFCYPQISHFYLIEGSFLSPHSPDYHVGNINSFLYASFNFGEVLKIKKENMIYVLCVNNKIVWRSDYSHIINFDKL